MVSPVPSPQKLCSAGNSPREPATRTDQPDRARCVVLSFARHSGSDSALEECPAETQSPRPSRPRRRRHHRLPRRPSRAAAGRNARRQWARHPHRRRRPRTRHQLRNRKSGAADQSGSKTVSYHIGFIVADRAEVDAAYQRLKASDAELWGEPHQKCAAAGDTLCLIPGHILVEVGAGPAGMKQCRVSACASSGQMATVSMLVPS